MPKVPNIKNFSNLVQLVAVTSDCINLEGVMDNEERSKLRTILDYWIEHNRQHSREFREWAGKAKGYGEDEAGKRMLQAAQEMDKASQSLSQALRSLDKEEL